MKEAALKRFHLGSDSYPQWAIHQAVPSMYNFENRIRFSNIIDHEFGFNPPADDSFYEIAINHFPARFITFGDQRFRLAKGRIGMFEMESVFGDTTLRSRWNLTQYGTGKIFVDRVSQEFEYADSDD